jgi:hypothetical protein
MTAILMLPPVVSVTAVRLDCVLLPEMTLSEMLSKLVVAYTIEYDNEFEHAIPHGTSIFGKGGPSRSFPPRVSRSGACG